MGKSMKNKKNILFALGLFIYGLFASAANIDLYYWPQKQGTYVSWTAGTNWMYESGGEQITTNVKEQIDAGNTINMIFDWNMPGFIPSNRTDIYAGDNGTYNIIESLIATGIPSTMAVVGAFQGIKTYSDAILTVKNDIWIKDGYFCISGFGYRYVDSSKPDGAWSYQSGSLNVGGQIKIIGNGSSLRLGALGARNESLSNGNFGPLNQVTVGYQLDDMGNKVSLDLSSTDGSKSLILNVGAHDNGYDVASIDSPDIVFNGIIKGASEGNNRAFIYTAVRGAVVAGSTTVSCEGIEGYVGIRNSDGSTKTSADSIQLTTIILKNEAGKTYRMTYALADTSCKATLGSGHDWWFSETEKTAIIMDGPGTQILENSASMRFSGGITVKQGTLLVNGKAPGSTDETFTHGDLDMQGGKFGIYNNTEGAGAFNFTNCYWKDGTLLLGLYDDAVDMIVLTGSFSAGVGEIGDVYIEFEGFGCAALTTEQKIISWRGYDSSTFSEDSFKAADMMNQMTGETMSAKFRLADDGLYVQYVAVPEPAYVGAFIALAALGFVFRRSRRK